MFGYDGVNWTLSDNIIYEFSASGISTGVNMQDLTITDNDISNCNSCVRWFNECAWGDTLRSGWVYNNRIFCDSGLGNIFQFQSVADDSADIEEGGAKYPDVWIYHNSCVGGCEVLNPRRFVTRDFKVVNNVFSGFQMIGDVEQADVDDTGLYAAFDYNFLGGLYGSWGYMDFAGADTMNQWSEDTVLGDITHQVWSLSAVPDWTVPDTSTADSAALNVFSDSFSIRGVTYAPLPGRSTAWPSLGAWGLGDTTPTTYGLLDVTSTPAGAAIWVEDVNTDSVTPCVIDSIETGTRTVKLTLAGYQDWTDDVVVVEGDTTAVDATLSVLVRTIKVSGGPTIIVTGEGTIVVGQ